MKAHHKRMRRGIHSSDSHITGKGVEQEFLRAQVLPPQLRDLFKMFELALAIAPQTLRRTWTDVLDSLLKESCSNYSRRRLEFIRMDKKLKAFWSWKVVETRPDGLIRLLSDTNFPTTLCLRRFHNHALDMNWLPIPILPEKHWARILAEQKRSMIRQRLGISRSNSRS